MSRGGQGPKVPQEWKDSVAKALEDHIASHGLADRTSRELAAYFGVSQSAFVHLRNKSEKATYGLQAMQSIASKIGRPIEALLGLTVPRDFAGERIELRTMREAILEILAILKERGPGTRSERAESRARAEVLLRVIEGMGGQLARDEIVENERRRAAG